MAYQKKNAFNTTKYNEIEKENSTQNSYDDRIENCAI